MDVGIGNSFVKIDVEGVDGRYLLLYFALMSFCSDEEMQRGMRTTGSCLTLAFDSSERGRPRGSFAEPPDQAARFSVSFAGPSSSEVRDLPKWRVGGDSSE